ncbi:hypothetical protein JHW43_000645 [Diplocarpon mali]|nr:hypothetical protein JHW43_000645 [Diplocarpon mali]
MGHWHRTFGTSRRKTPEEEDKSSRNPSEEDDMSREEYDSSRRDHPDEEFGLPRPTGHFDASEFGDSVDTRYNRYPTSLKPSIQSSDMQNSIRNEAEKHQAPPVPCAQITLDSASTVSTVLEPSPFVSQHILGVNSLPALALPAKLDVASTHNEDTSGFAIFDSRQTSGTNLSPTQAPYGSSTDGSKYPTLCATSYKRDNLCSRTSVTSSQITSHNRGHSGNRQVRNPVVQKQDYNVRQRPRTLSRETSLLHDTGATVEEGSYFGSPATARTGLENDASCLESPYGDNLKIPENQNFHKKQEVRGRISPSYKDSVDDRREREESRRITEDRGERIEVAASERPTGPVGSGSGSGRYCEQSMEKRKKAIQPRSEITTAAPTPSRVNVNGQVFNPSIRSHTSAFDMMERVSRSAPKVSVGIDHILDHASTLMPSIYTSPHSDSRCFSDDLRAEFSAIRQKSGNKATSSNEAPSNVLISGSQLLDKGVVEPVVEVEEEGEDEVQSAESSSRGAGAHLPSSVEVNANAPKNNSLKAPQQKSQSMLRQSISIFNLRDRTTTPQPTPRPRPIIGEPLRPEHTWGKGTVMEEALDLPPPAASMGLISSSKDVFTVTPRTADYVSVPTLRKSSTIAQMNSQPSTLRSALKTPASQGAGSAAAPRSSRSKNTVHFDLPAAAPQLTKSSTVAQMMGRVPVLSRAPVVRSRNSASKLNSMTDESASASYLEQFTEGPDKVASDNSQASGFSSMRPSIPSAPRPLLSKSKSMFSIFSLSNKRTKDLKKMISKPIEQTSEHLQGRGSQFGGVTGQQLPSNVGVDPRLLDPDFSAAANYTGPGIMVSRGSANMVTHIQGNSRVSESRASRVALNTTQAPKLVNTRSPTSMNERPSSSIISGPGPANKRAGGISAIKQPGGTDTMRAPTSAHDTSAVLGASVAVSDCLQARDSDTTSSQRPQEKNKSTAGDSSFLGSSMAVLENKGSRSPGTMSNFVPCDSQGQRTQVSSISPRQYSSINELRTRHTATPTRIPSPIIDLANGSRTFTSPGVPSRRKEDNPSTAEHSLTRNIPPARLHISGIPMAKSRNLDSFSSFGRSMANSAVRNQSTDFLRAEPTTAVSVELAVAQASDEKKFHMIYESPDGVYPWSGHVSSLESRFRTELQDQLLSSPTVMERFQNREEPPKPDMRHRMSDNSLFDIDDVVDTVGLANYVDEEERIFQRAFIVLAGRCVGEATKHSLWEYQGLFAQVRRIPALKPRPRDVPQASLMSRFSRVIGRSSKDV